MFYTLTHPFTREPFGRKGIDSTQTLLKPGVKIFHFKWDVVEIQTRDLLSCWLWYHVKEPTLQKT